MIAKIWYAMVQVIPINGNNQLDSAKGAFVNVAYKAGSKQEFLGLIKDTFLRQNFMVKEIDDVGMLTDNNADNPEKISLLNDMQDYDYSWGDFHTYEEEE
jgi:hypothetical protein